MVYKLMMLLLVIMTALFVHYVGHSHAWTTDL